jgi:hypothetical protein
VSFFCRAARQDRAKAALSMTRRCPHCRGNLPALTADDCLDLDATERARLTELLQPKRNRTRSAEPGEQDEAKLKREAKSGAVRVDERGKVRFQGPTARE